jgi:hypothetical protein
MRRVVGVVTVAFWASAALMTVLVGLSWVAPGLRDQQSFLLLSGVSVGLAMVCSGLLSAEEGEEWTPKAWLYATAFGLSFFISWYLLPALFFS